MIELEFDKYMERSEQIAEKFMSELKDDNKEVILAVLSGLILTFLDGYPPNKRLDMFKSMKEFINFRIELEKAEKSQH
jgi:hypothetical protein